MGIVDEVKIFVGYMLVSMNNIFQFLKKAAHQISNTPTIQDQVMIAEKQMPFSFPFLNHCQPPKRTFL